MDGLYTNRSTNRDFAYNAFSRYGQSCDVLIASAFFSSADTIIGLLERGCQVQLIVRLAAATSPSELKNILRKPGVQIRYFTDQSFHPKLYIFGAACALVGSANLTRAGLTNNQEVVVALKADDPRFDELVRLFTAFWDEAQVLTVEVLDRFAEIVRRNATKPDLDVDSAVRDALGRHAFKNVERGLPKPGRRQEFLDGYRRRYQSFRDTYDVVYRIYRSVGRRITPPDFPLRIEVDQWFSFIREGYAGGDSYHSAPFRSGQEQETLICRLVEEYIAEGREWLTGTVVPRSYPLITSTFRSASTIEAATEDQIYEALLCVHAFHDRFRFYDGGGPTMRVRFIEDNGIARIKSTLTHLLHGHPSDHVVRMADCISDPNYRLQHFGEMCVQETYGWVNNEDVPICNGRTLKSLRWLGFKVNPP